MSSSPVDPEVPQSFHNVITDPHIDQISSHVTSNNIYQSAGRGIRFKRVVRRIAAHARVFGGWIV